MHTFNRVIVLGYLGGDPELRYTGGETARPVTNFSVATTDKWKDGGETKEDTQWHRCVAWGKQAELVKNLLKKGSKVYLEGQLKTRRWTDAKDKIERSATEIVVDLFSALDDAPQAKAEKKAVEASGA